MPKNEIFFSTEIITDIPRILAKVTVKKNKKQFTTIALIDTGATKSAITAQCVERLQLMPTGSVDLVTSSATEKSFLYNINLVWNGIKINDLDVTYISYTDPSILEADVIIGMDVLGLGLFCTARHGDIIQCYLAWDD
jgi:predicted aspartyl protease